MTIPRFLVPSTELTAGALVTLAGRELHHLRVRRLRVGDRIALVDGNDNEFTGQVEAISRQAARIRLFAARRTRSESPLRLVLAQALIQPNRLSSVIEKATELGVSRIVLFSTARTIGGTSSGPQERWHRIAAAAIKQSQRSIVPPVDGPLTFQQMLDETSEQGRVLIWEGAALEHAFSAGGTTPLTSVRLLVGPEGGFTDSEIDAAVSAGFRPVTLGPRVLRSETAAIAAAAIAQFLWGDLTQSTS